MFATYLYNSRDQARLPLVQTLSYEKTVVDSPPAHDQKFSLTIPTTPVRGEGFFHSETKFAHGASRKSWSFPFIFSFADQALRQDVHTSTELYLDLCKMIISCYGRMFSKALYLSRVIYISAVSIVLIPSPDLKRRKDEGDGIAHVSHESSYRGCSDHCLFQVYFRLYEIKMSC